MKNISLFLPLVFLAFTALSAQNLNITFRSKMTFPDESLGNVWGYAANGREYALVAGTKKGLYIVDVTNPDNPNLIATLPYPASEVQTYSHYAYSVGPGLFIVDLQNLPAPDLSWRQYKGDGEIEGKFNGAHTLHIDTAKGFLYPHGSSIDLANVALDLNDDPFDPKFAGKIPFFQYTHDGYVNNDTLYGAQINEGVFSIIDMSDKSNPKLLGSQATPGVFTHNTWPGPDRKTLYTTDEISGGYLAAYEVSDPSDIQFLDKFRTNPGSNATPHNTEIMGNYAVTAWYSEGVSIVDVARPSNLVEVGRFDTYPEFSGPGYVGCWGACPYLPSGIILASNRNGELWILSPDYTRAAYLEGKIVDAATGTPIAGAEVKFKDFPLIEPRRSSPVGMFRTGIPESGTVSVQVSKFGYYTKTINFNLLQGEVTNVEIQLVPRPVAKVSGVVVREDNNMPVSGAHVRLFNPEFIQETQTDAGGAFLFEQVPQGGKLDLIAGAWGYEYNVLKDQLITPVSHQNLILALKIGYQDHFIFDYGWEVSGTSLTGVWERTQPGQFPGLDFPFNLDLGDQCYVTGISDFPLQQNGVNEGDMILTSPPIILSHYTNPLLTYSFHFEAWGDGLDGPPELLHFIWGIGDSEINKSSANSAISWRTLHKAPISDLIPRNDTIRFKVKAIDNPAIVNYNYEALFDWFNIEEGSPSAATSPDASVHLTPMPNPFQDFTRVQYELPESGCLLSVSDMAGRVLQTYKLADTNGVLELGKDLLPGVYFVQLSKNGATIQIIKLIKTG